MPNSHFAISHFEVNEGGFALFSSLLIEIKRLEKEVMEIKDELDAKRGDYLFSELSQLTSIASLLPSFPAIVCNCGAVHLLDLKLGGHKTCPACGNRWELEEKRISEGGGSSPLITPPLKLAPFSDEDEDVGVEYVKTIISSEKPIVYISSDSNVIEAKKNVIVIDASRVQRYNKLLKDLEEKTKRLEECYDELESKCKKYKNAIEDLVNYSGILICEGKCAVIFKDGEVKCFSDDPSIDTLKLEIDIKTAIKFLFKL
jgi:hypothetical protein